MARPLHGMLGAGLFRATENPGITVSPIDESRIQVLVEELDEAVPRRGRLVVDDDDESCGTLVRVNRTGYLRLGIEFLKAAYVVKDDEDHPDRVKLDLNYLTGLDDHCYAFERRENMDVRATSTDDSSNARNGLAGFALFLLVVSVFLYCSSFVGNRRVYSYEMEYCRDFFDGPSHKKDDSTREFDLGKR